VVEPVLGLNGRLSLAACVDSSGVILNLDTGCHKVGAELEQSVSSPLGEVAACLPARTEIASDESANDAYQGDQDFHRADVSRVKSYKEDQFAD